MQYTYSIVELDPQNEQGAYIKILYDTEGDQFPQVPVQVAIPRLRAGFEQEDIAEFAKSQSTGPINIWKRIQAEIDRESEYQEYLSNLDISTIQTNVVVTEEAQTEPNEDQILAGWRAFATVTMRQARLALSQQGLLSTVQENVSQLPEDAQIEWEYAGQVERQSSLMSTLGAALGLTEEQLDDLFRFAETL